MLIGKERGIYRWKTAGVWQTDIALLKRELFQLKCRKKGIARNQWTAWILPAKHRGALKLCRRKISLKAETNL